MSKRAFRETALVASLVWSAASAPACTTDFASYRLRISGTDAGTGFSSDGLADAGGEAQASGRRAGAGGAAGHGATNGGSTANGGGTPTGGNGGGDGGGDSIGAGGAGGTGTGGSTTVAGPSCNGLAPTCGPKGNASCCATALVPGGTYDRSDSASSPATVSDLLLDTYEITVGRFRNFVAAYSQSMIPPGSGKNPNDLAGDPGWSVTWNQYLPADAAALSAAVSCHPSFETWTPTPAAHESRPITCLSWFEAYAFCIWDGGRLPTEAEWNYAATGGDEQRLYPWGIAPPDDSYTVFCGGSCAGSENVGSKSPRGDGKWGQADLDGNAWEWNVDYFTTTYPAGACMDCATTTTSAASPATALRVFRGASFGNNSSYLLSSARYSRIPTDHNGYIGARCARAP